MDDIKQGKHKLHTVGDGTLGDGKANEQLQSVFRFLDFCERAASFDHTGDKEQHKECKSDRLHCAVDVDDHAPYSTAFEVLRRCRNKLPNLSQLFVPSFQCVFKVLYDPVVAHEKHLLFIELRGAPAFSGTPLGVKFLSRQSGRGFPLQR